MTQTLFAPRAFAVPPELEAHEPPESRGVPRDHVQLLVSERVSGNLRHSMFVDIAAWLRRGDLVVVNDSATIPAALDGIRSEGGTLAVHLSSPVTGTLWIVEPRGAVAPAEAVELPSGGTATFLAPFTEGPSRLWYARLDVPEPLDEYLAAHGRPVRYRHARNDVPIGAYQTMFARVPGSAEMPSAGRPFTPRVVDDLVRHGIEIVHVTHHCGVSSAETGESPPPERFDVGTAAARRINAAHRERRRVIAVGTTVVRALESAWHDGEIVATRGWTDLVVTPQRGVSAVDGILTGLHEPRASHIALLEALLPAADLAEAYAAAAEHRYLWHEFGDMHFIV